ncbi:MOSC domain-containing protein [Salipiger sp.]|uniref:MOSC domain-containing protein n=1 Tax=Salipiger sp. TaxID=2078585 RepID=UPI003A96F27E
MTARVAEIWRHPIKGIGREALNSVTLDAGRPLPGDRAWALLHDNAADAEGWQARRNFLVVASGPRLAQISAETLAHGRIALSHPDRPRIEISPLEDEAALIDWVLPLWPADRPAPRRLVQAPPQGMADNGAAQLAILNRASLAELGEAVGQVLDIGRFRGNLVLDGLAPREEFDWIGRELAIGDIRLAVTDRIERCRATEANPATGLRDANILRALEDTRGHRDFGVYATVRSGGFLTTDTPVTLI